ncbi:MAG: S16 family serine protease [Verrucomicrobiota bacterium]
MKWHSLAVAWPLLFATAQSAPKLNQSQIKGLLVFELDDGSLAARASQMNATAVEIQDNKFEVGFNQSVGEMMSDATEEVGKFLHILHGEDLPNGTRIEFAFSNKYSPKDGPSAAVVCALLANSIITGQKIDPDFAATGDMTATGKVRPVGGIYDKIRGATKKGCTLVAIPKTNRPAVDDAYLLEGLAPLHSIQIFTIETFQEAQALACEKKTDSVQQAIDEFTLIQKALTNNPKYITNAKVREKLRTICKLLPNHLSAELLLLHSYKKGPTKLSLEGSLNGIDQAGNRLGQMIQNRSYTTSGGNSDVLYRLINEFQNLRPKLDKRTIEYADAYRKLAEFIKEVRGRRTWNAQLDREIQAALSKVGIERDNLINDPDIQEELSLE